MLISELGMRLGGDPRGFAEYQALRDELMKLSHPARPDLDWRHVEKLCLALQQDNGLELQSMVVLILARAHLYALPGVLDGMQSLNRRLPPLWGQLWPQPLPARLELLSWLFDQLQPMLRTTELVADDLPLVQQLKVELDGLSVLLMQSAQVPLVSLQALRQQLERSVLRISREAISSDFLVLPSQPTACAPSSGVAWQGQGQVATVAAPQAPEVIVVTVPSAQAPRESRKAKWLIWLGVLISIAVLGVGGLSLWRWYLVPIEEKSPTPIQLDSLLLFPPGSAKLRPDATKVLVHRLINIKAQPGWLIVITGHSDSTGDAQRNMELSHARAVAVREWMQQMGDIPDNCFAVRGAGANEPTDSNETEEGRNANRRVEISLVPVAGACGHEAGRSQDRRSLTALSSVEPK